MAIEKELLDQLLEGRDPETVFTQDGLLDELKKGLSERVLNAELDAHLDAETADGKTNRHITADRRRRSSRVRRR